MYPTRGRILLKHEHGSNAHSLTLSAFHWLDMIEMLLKGNKTMSGP